MRKIRSSIAVAVATALGALLACSGKYQTATDGGASADASGPCVVRPPASCGLAPQCGCGANETCDVVDENGGTSCVTAGTATQGRGCVSTGDCVATLKCIFGACRPYCPTAGVACDTLGTGGCFQVTTAAAPPVNVPNLSVCTVTCQLDDATSCGGLPASMSDPVAACTPVHAAGISGDCRQAGRSTNTCGAVQNGVATPPFCAPGYGCAGNLTCFKWCRVGVAGLCSGGQTCTPFPTGIVVDGTAFGHCQ